MKSRTDCEEKKEYYQIGYTVRAYSNKVAVTKIPLFVCLNEIQKKVPIEKRQETIDQMRKNLETPYLHRCDCLEKEGYQIQELKEGYVLRDTKDQKAKLIYETCAIFGLRDKKGDSTNSFQIYYQILISPKKFFSEATENMLSNLANLFEKEAFNYIEKKKTEKLELTSNQ